MQCLHPRTVGFKADGKTLSWSPRDRNKEHPDFQIPCGKCLQCRINYGTMWGIRCVHEAQMHHNNCFITLTYSDENLKNPKLQYLDFQLFMKRLRKKYTVDEKTKIGYLVTGEYGEKDKRPHWHVIIFNFRPNDLEYYRSNERGDKLYRSRTLDSLWGKNDSEKCPTLVGDVNFNTASYVARYSLKKLGHGHDQEHEYHPISKKSSDQAIGKKFIEKYWEPIFNNGYIIHDGVKYPIPRYYEKWLQKHHPQAWENYVTGCKQGKIDKAQKRASKEMAEYTKRQIQRTTGNYIKGFERTKSQARETILKQRVARLKENSKC